MKLLVCNKCYDVFNIVRKEERSCSCGESKGRYHEDGLHAYYIGDATPLGFSNFSYLDALENQPESGMGEKFEAFVIPKKCPTFKKRVSLQDGKFWVYEEDL